MTDYHDLCNQNKTLYAKLEQLTLLIGNAIVNQDQQGYKLLLQAKYRVNEMIERNLDMIEFIWQEPVRISEIQLKHSTRKEQIINYFIMNPDFTLKKIGKDLGVDKTYVSEVISREVRKNKGALMR